MTLVTGFLGSGKTTLINAALRSPELSKTVVVVNEFGETGLDHQLFASSSNSVVVLENGCLCCTVRSDLIGTLNSLYHARQAGEIPAFDNVVIETSGLAEPGPVLQAFLSEPTLDGLYRVAGVLTLVDAVNWSGTSEAHEESVRQVALADQIRITKLDLVNGDRQNALVRIRLDLRRINPSAEIAAVDWSSAAVAALLASRGFDPADPSADPRPWLNVQSHQNDAHDHDHHGNDHAHDASGHHLEGRGIENFVLTRESPLTRAEVQFLLEGIAQNLGAGLLRVKGLGKCRRGARPTGGDSGRTASPAHNDLARALARQRSSDAHRIHHPGHSESQPQGHHRIARSRQLPDLQGPSAWPRNVGSIKDHHSNRMKFNNRLPAQRPLCRYQVDGAGRC